MAAALSSSPIKKNAAPPHDKHAAARLNSGVFPARTRQHSNHKLIMKQTTAVAAAAAASYRSIFSLSSSCNRDARRRTLRRSAERGAISNAVRNGKIKATTTVCALSGCSGRTLRHSSLIHTQPQASKRMKARARARFRRRRCRRRHADNTTQRRAKMLKSSRTLRIKVCVVNTHKQSAFRGSVSTPLLPHSQQQQKCSRRRCSLWRSLAWQLRSLHRLRTRKRPTRRSRTRCASPSACPSNSRRSSPPAMRRAKTRASRSASAMVSVGWRLLTTVNIRFSCSLDHCEGNDCYCTTC